MNCFFLLVHMSTFISIFPTAPGEFSPCSPLCLSAPSVLALPLLLCKGAEPGSGRAMCWARTGKGTSGHLFKKSKTGKNSGVMHELPCSHCLGAALPSRANAKSLSKTNSPALAQECVLQAETLLPDSYFLLKVLGQRCSKCIPALFYLPAAGGRVAGNIGFCL